MKLHDITLPLSPQTPAYPGDKGVSVSPIHRIASGGAYNSSELGLSTHSGTHIDPPAHFLLGGATIDQLPLDTFYGEAWVAELGSEKAITADDLNRAGIPCGTKRLLLKTRNSVLWERSGFQADFVYIEPEAARWLADLDLKLVGLDYLTIDPLNAAPEAHLILLKAGVAIVEGLDLRPVHAGLYTLACLPLKVQGGDGAPARAILIEE